jgi:K+/H+ antiporter YhaU regulatory subunit KhtT
MRYTGEAEVGDPAVAAAGAVIAVLRGGTVLAPDDPRAARLEKGDQLIMVSTRARLAGPS